MAACNGLCCGSLGLIMTIELLQCVDTQLVQTNHIGPKFQRGIGAARNWGAAEFGRISRACGSCLQVERIADRFDGPRAPDGVIVENVLAIQKGTGDPAHVIIIAGHIDSRVTDPMNFTADAPGANDDASGTALVIEAARLLSKQKHRATIVYALLSGEEQGLWGGKLLAKHAKGQNWQVAAMLNNDIVGGNSGSALINAKGEVVGLIFDGNINSISGAYWFDTELNRAVAVDTTIIREALRKVYDAKALATEMGLR